MNIRDQGSEKKIAHPMMSGTLLTGHLYRQSGFAGDLAPGRNQRLLVAAMCTDNVNEDGFHTRGELVVIFVAAACDSR